MTVEDLASYETVIRKPVEGEYRGYKIVSMPPPSSGGIHIIEILNILEGYPLGDYGQNSAQTIHLMAEAMQSFSIDVVLCLSSFSFSPIFISILCFL